VADIAPATRKEKLWLPLESNPSLMNKYMVQLGVHGPWEFLDVYGTDDDLLGMVPQPVLAVMLLFPISGASEAQKQEEEKLIQTNGQAVSNNVYFIKQTVGNACGTIGLIHCISNVRQQLRFGTACYRWLLCCSVPSFLPSDVKRVHRGHQFFCQIPGRDRQLKSPRASGCS
jgi:hypothetical protein